MEQLISDLTSVCYAYLVFALAYLANILFSLYYNIKLKGYDFNKYLLWDSARKAILFIVATLILVFAVNAATRYLAAYIPQLNEEVKNAVSITMVVSTIGRAALKYIIEAYQTFANILDGKQPTLTDSTEMKE